MYDQQVFSCLEWVFLVLDSMICFQQQGFDIGNYLVEDICDWLEFVVYCCSGCGCDFVVFVDFFYQCISLNVRVFL